MTTSRRWRRSSRDVIRPATELPEHLGGRLVAGVQLEGLFEMPPREHRLSLEGVRAGEIRVCVEVATVPGGFEGLLEPRDRVVRLPELQKVRADIIVRITETGV